MSKKNKHRTNKKEKFCDPAVCDHCMYICEGDFLCDKYDTIVVSDWQPAEDYMKCREGDDK